MKETKDKKNVLDLQGKKWVYHIVIEGHNAEEVRALFEEIQNKYSLYDNCVFEEAEIEDTIIDYDEGRWEETGKLGCMDKKEFNKLRKGGN